MSRTHLTIFYHLLFLIITIMAVILNDTRFFLDGGAHLICAINRDGFCLVQGRHILLFSQLLPVIGIKLHWSLHYIMLSFLLSHILFLYLLFAIAHYWIRDEAAGMLLLLSTSLSIGYTYYLFPMAEILYGIPLVILLVSIILHDKYRTLPGAILSMACLYFIIMGHQLVWIALFFGLFLLLTAPEKRKVALLIILVSIVVVTIILFNDREAIMSKITRENRLPEMSSSSLLHSLQASILSNQVIVVFVLIITIGLVWLKRYLHGIALVGASLFTLVLIAESPGGYVVVISGMGLLSLSVILAEKKEWMRSVPFAIMCLLFFAIGNAEILALSGSFRRALQHTQRLIDYGQRIPGDKFIIDEANNRRSGPNYYYNASLLFSTRSGNGTVILFSDDVARSTFTQLESSNEIPDSNFMALINKGFTEQRNWTLSETEDPAFIFNPVYFDVSNDNFRLLRADKQNDIEYIRDNFQIEILSASHRRPADPYNIVTQVGNHGELPFYCHPDNDLYLLLYAKDLDIYSIDTQYLAVDVGSVFEQDLNQGFRGMAQSDSIEIHVFKDSVLAARTQTWIMK